MKVGLVIGPCVPGECGVGDYTIRLQESLTALGVSATLLNRNDWCSRVGLAEARKPDFDIVHIQYPTAGFGLSLSPQFFALLRPSIVTIHEMSQRRFLRKLSLAPFLIRPKRIIFTTKFELRYAQRWVPWISKRAAVIPVGSNIRQYSLVPQRSTTEIVHFGLIMPKKGVEDVLELARLIKASGLSHKISIIGKVPSRHSDYWQRLRNESSGLPITWEANLSDEGVARRLSESAIAYLPYPDGASDRRTTLKAALLAGMAVISNRGEHTSHALERAVRLCPTPTEALLTVRELCERPEDRLEMCRRAVHYSSSYSWERIAKRHIRVYKSVLSNT